MAVAVIYGLGLATCLTLFVVPVLYSLVNSARRRSLWLLYTPVRFWWVPFDLIFGTRYARRWSGDEAPLQASPSMEATSASSSVKS